MIKKIKLAIAVVFMLVSIYVVIGPFLTVYHINAGLVENDAELLVDNIEFSTLRHNMKDQLNVIKDKNGSASVKHNPLLALGSLIAKTVVDQLIDNIVTPEGLASILESSADSSMRHGEPLIEPADKNDITGEKIDYFKNARYAYQSANRFSVWIPNKHGEETQFVLKREGFSWRLVNIIIPLNILAKKSLKKLF